MDNIKVAIRVRPLISKEQGQASNWIVKDNAIAQKEPGGKTGNPYTFDRIFDEHMTTYDIFEDICKPIIDSAVGGFHGTIFAYGQSSSGKTFTMSGSAMQPGIIKLSVNEIFEKITELADREFLLRCSYMEIYNEKVSDLLSSEEKPIRLQEDTDRNIIVSGLSEELVKDCNDVYKVIKDGDARRHMAETKQNDRSSRSHCIMRIIIESRALQDETAVMVSHLNFVDLAGSEKAGENSGDRFREGCAINKSLFSLSQVISKLSDGVGHQHIGYRDSKLTRILQNALGGNSKTAIIATITPATVEESHSTLRFASRAKTISNKPQLNEVLSDAALLKRSQIEIKRLQEKIKQLEQTDFLVEKEDLQNQLVEKEEARSKHEELINQLKFIIVSGNKESQPPQKKRRRETWCPGKGAGRRMSFLNHVNFVNDCSELSVISEISPPQIRDKKGKRSFEELASPENSPLSSTLRLPARDDNFIQTRRSNHLSFSPDVKTKELMALQDKHELLMNDYSRLKVEMEEQETFHNLERETLEENINCLSEELNFFKSSVPEIEVKCQKNEDENETLKTRVSDLQTQLEQKTEMYHGAHKEMKEMEMKMNLLSDEVFQLQHKLEIQTTKLSDYQGELTELRRGEDEDKKEHVQADSEQTDVDKRTIQELKEKVETQMSSVSDLQNINEELRHQHTTTEEMLRNKLEDLEKEVERLNAEAKLPTPENTSFVHPETSDETLSLVHKQNEEIKELSLELERVKEEMNMKSEHDTNQINMYKAEIENQEELIEKLTLELDGLAQEVENNTESGNQLLQLQYEEQIQAQSDKIAELTEAISMLNNKGSECSTSADQPENGEMLGRVTKLENECEQLLKEKAELKCLLAELEEEKNGQIVPVAVSSGDVEGVSNEYKQQIDQLKQEHESNLRELNEKVSQLQRQLALYEDETSDIHTTDIKDILDAKLEMNARLTKQKEEYDQQLQRLNKEYETEKQELRNRIAGCEETISNLQTEKSMLKDPSELMVEFQGILETVKSEHSLELENLKEKYENELSLSKSDNVVADLEPTNNGDADQLSQRHQDEINDLKQTLESQRIEYEKRVRDLEELLVRKEDMNCTDDVSSQLINESEDLKAKIHHLESSLKKNKELLELTEEAAKNDMDKLQCEMSELKSDMTTKEEKFRCLEESSRLRSEELQDKCDQLQQEVQQLEKLKSELQLSKSCHDMNNTEQKESKVEGQQEVVRMTIQDMEVQTETDASCARECLRCELLQGELVSISEMKQEHESTQEKYKTVLQECESLKSEVKSLQAKFSEPVVNEVGDSSTEMKILQQSYESMKEENMKLEREIELLKEQESSVTPQADTEMQGLPYQSLKDEKEILEREIEMLKSQVNSGTDESNMEIQQSYQNLKEEKLKLEQEIETLKEQDLATSSQTNEELQELYNCIKEEKLALEKEIESLRHQDSLACSQKDTEMQEAFQNLMEEKLTLEKELEILRNVYNSESDQPNIEMMKSYENMREEKQLLEKKIETLRNQENSTSDSFDVGSDVETLRSEKERLESIIESGKVQFFSMKEKCESLQEQVTTLEEINTELQESCQSQESDVEHWKQECERLCQEISILNSENQELKENQEQKEKLTSEIERLQQESAELSKEKEAHCINNDQLREQIEELNRNISELEQFRSRCKTLEQTLETEQEENIRLKDNDKAHQTQRNEYEIKAVNLTDLCEKLKNENEELKEISGKLSTENSKSTEMIDRLEQKACMLEETVKEFQEESEKYLEEKKILEDQLSEVQETLSQYLSPDCVQREIEKQTLSIRYEHQEKIAQYEQRIETLTSDIEKYKSECSNEKLSLVEQVKAQYEEELRLKCETVVELKGELSETMSRLSEAESRTSEVEQEIYILREQYESLQSKTEHAKMENQTEVNSLNQKYQEVCDELQQQIKTSISLRDSQTMLTDQMAKLQQKSSLYEETMKELQEESEKKSLEWEKESGEREEEIVRLKKKVEVCNSEIQKLQQMAQEYANEVRTLQESEKKFREAATDLNQTQTKADEALRAENENLKQENKKAKQTLCNAINNAREKIQASKKELGQKTMENITLKHELEKSKENLQKSTKQYEETMEMHENRIAKLKNEIRRLQTDDTTIVEPVPRDLNPVQQESSSSFSGAGGAVDHFANILLESEKKRLLKEVTTLTAKLQQSRKESVAKSAENEKLTSQVKELQSQLLKKTQITHREPLEDTNYKEEILTPASKIPSSASSIGKAPGKTKFHIPDLDPPKPRQSIIEKDIPDQVKENCKVQ